MRTLIVFLAAAVLSFANITYTGHAVAVTTSSAATSSVSANVTVANGDFMVAFVAAQGSCTPTNTFPQFSDGTSTLTIDKYINSGSVSGLWAARGFASVTGTVTITATFYTDATYTTTKNCTYRLMSVDTFSGVKATSPLDGTPVATSGTSSSIDAGSNTTLLGSVLVCGYATTSSSRTFTDATISIVATANGAASVSTGHLLNASAGAHHCTATIGGGSSTWLAIGVAYLPASYNSASTAVRRRVSQ